MTILAFDLGGTRLKAGVVDARAAAVTAQIERPSPPGERALAELVSVGRDLLGDAQPAGVGLAVPGLVADGEVVSLPGKLEGLVGLDLAKGLREAFDAEAVVVNDAIAYGIGEARAGAGAGHERVVVVTIGTGVGVAVLQAGRPVTPGMLGGGLLGGAIPIGAGDSGTGDSGTGDSGTGDSGAGPAPDTAGRTDTIEAHCRAQRIAALAGVATVEEAYARHAAGDATAARALQIYRDGLARALAALALAHAPGCLVVGGGPAFEGAPIFDGLRDAVRARLFPGYSVDVRAGSLGADAALLGLAGLMQP